MPDANESRTPSISGQEMVTEEMMEAGLRAYVDQCDHHAPAEQKIAMIYRAMVSAVSLGDLPDE